MKKKTDIVEVISRYIPLRKAGKNRAGLCPFHQERTPSFIVNPKKQIFHCFGCGAEGDADEFVRRLEARGGTHFPAEELLIREQGIPKVCGDEKRQVPRTCQGFVTIGGNKQREKRGTMKKITATLDQDSKRYRR